MKRQTLIGAWFALSSFLCSALLFWVEPLVGKQLLPLTGGAPAVWNVCLLFFQASLLLGYATSHALTRVRSPRIQASVFALLGVASFLILPIRFAQPPIDVVHPTAWLLFQLSRTLLLPFLTLSSAAPLLQHWYSRGERVGADDPYVLYAASNTGSLIALLSFPVFLEPHLRLHTQNHLWASAFIVAIAVCVGASFSARGATAAEKATVSTAPIRIPSFLLWIALAAVPSSLLMGVTTYLTSDIPPVPLLWVVPLAIYLATFIVAFGGMRNGPAPWHTRAVVLLSITWCMLYRLQATDPLWLLVIVHLVVFGFLATGAHSRVAALRPPAAHLSAYYLAIAIGGAVGGIFNALIAPAIFHTYAEYPLVMLCAILLNVQPITPSSSHASHSSLKLPLSGLVAIAVITVLSLATHIAIGPLRAVLLVGAPLLIAFGISRSFYAFVAALAIVVIGARFDSQLQGRVLHTERNFYGVLRVTTDPNRRYHEERHGNTLHGASDVLSVNGSMPLMYYWTGSPIAEVIRDMQRRRDSADVAIIGLGVGSLAWYARPTERWTYFEINPQVITVARDARWFGFLSRSRAGNLAIVPGDARINLRGARAASYDLIVLDAFTSDAIPLHLLTTEAVQSYLHALKPGGIIALHVSNRYLDLAPPIASVGASLGLRAWFREVHVSDELRARRIESSDWMVLARSSPDFPLSAVPQWTPVAVRGAPWTDDYSDIWPALVH